MSREKKIKTSLEEEVKVSIQNKKRTVKRKKESYQKKVGDF